MKRILGISIAILLIIALSSCSNSDNVHSISGSANPSPTEPGTEIGDSNIQAVSPGAADNHAHNGFMDLEYSVSLDDLPEMEHRQPWGWARLTSDVYVGLPEKTGNPPLLNEGDVFPYYFGRVVGHNIDGDFMHIYYLDSDGNYESSMYFHNIAGSEIKTYMASDCFEILTPDAPPEDELLEDAIGWAMALRRVIIECHDCPFGVTLPIQKGGILPYLYDEKSENHISLIKDGFTWLSQSEEAAWARLDLITQVIQ